MTRILVVHGHTDPGRQLPSRECVRRLDYAERVAYRELSEYVLVSGCWEAMHMKAMWRGPGHVIAERASHCTRENVANVVRMIGLLTDEPQVTVVTSWWHVPRTRMLWQDTFVDPRVLGCRGSWRYVRREVGAFLRELEAEAQLVRAGVS